MCLCQFWIKIEEQNTQRYVKNVHYYYDGSKFYYFVVVIRIIILTHTMLIISEKIRLRLSQVYAHIVKNMTESIKLPIQTNHFFNVNSFYTCCETGRESAYLIFVFFNLIEAQSSFNKTCKTRYNIFCVKDFIFF